LKAWIENEEGKFWIDIPFSLEGFENEHWCDFLNAQDEFYEANKSLPEGIIKEDYTEKEIQDLYEVTFTGVDQTRFLFQAVSMFVTGNIDYLTYSVDSEEKTKEMLNKGHLIKAGDPISIVRLYMHIITLVNQYKPEAIPPDYFIEWYEKPLQGGKKRRKNDKKVKYYIQPNDVAVSFKFKSKHLKFSEVYLMSLVQDKFEQQKKSRKHLYGNALFNLNISSLAILLRKEGEKLPIDKKDYEPFLSERKQAFKDLPLSTVLDVRFFFQNIIEDCVQSSVTNIFSKEKKRSNQVILSVMQKPSMSGKKYMTP